MVETKNEVGLEIFYRNTVKMCARTGNIAVVTMSDSKGIAILDILHRKTKRKQLAPLLKRIRKIEKAQETANMPMENRVVFTAYIVPPDDLPYAIHKWREARAISGFKPYIVFEALTDVTQYNRGKGGKSPSAIQKHLRNNGTFLTMQEIERNLVYLREIGAVVKSITGAWWPKAWFRETMRDMGISYLPTKK